MNFKLNFEIPSSTFTFKHGEGLIFLGSCFSNEMAEKAKFHGLNVKANHFGTVFHPSLLSRFISESIEGVEKERIFNRKDIFLSWDANSTVFDYSASALSSKLKSLRNDFFAELRIAKVLYVTFGTAWAYRNLDTNSLVANCHKIPTNHFTKELVSIDTLYAEWKSTIEKIRAINSNIEIVFTVSPVRHIRDGLIENNQSKAILIEVVRKLTNQLQCSYFPSYEIVIDELRDYRFYKVDRVHPSEEAIDYVWKRFEEHYCDEETKLLNTKVSNFRRTLAHRSIHEDSKDHQEQRIQSEKQLNEFLAMFPQIEF
jgi:hypothetical protein